MNTLLINHCQFESCILIHYQIQFQMFKLNVRCQAAFSVSLISPKKVIYYPSKTKIKVIATGKFKLFKVVIGHSNSSGMQKTTLF